MARSFNLLHSRAAARVVGLYTSESLDRFMAWLGVEPVMQTIIRKGHTTNLYQESDVKAAKSRVKEYKTQLGVEAASRARAVLAKKRANGEVAYPKSRRRKSVEARPKKAITRKSRAPRQHERELMATVRSLNETLSEVLEIVRVIEAGMPTAIKPSSTSRQPLNPALPADKAAAILS